MLKADATKLLQIIEAKREDIVQMSKDCYEQSLDGDCFQGWIVGILVDTDGDINSFYRSQNTTSQAEFDDEAVVVVSYVVTNDQGEITYSMDDLTESEIINFKKFLLENEYEDAWEEDIDYNTLCEFSSDIVSRIDKENLEWVIEESYQDAAEQQIEHTLEFLEIEQVVDNNY